MKTNTDTLRITSRTDVLALPTALLGFMPEDSLVMIHMLERRVEFSLRMDAQAVRSNPDGIADYVSCIAAAEHRLGGMWLCLLFVECPDEHLLGLTILEERMANILAVLVTDGWRSWEFQDGILSHEEPFDARSSTVLAQAVYCGKQVSATREEAVSVLSGPRARPEWTEDARRAVAVWEDADDRLRVLRDLVVLDEPDEHECAVMGLLLAEEDCFAAMLTRLRVASAEAWFELLLRVREYTPVEGLPNVVALLTMAGWLNGAGAITTECLIELEDLEPGHPVIALIHTMQRHAIPPSRWDEPEPSAAEWEGA